MKWATAYLHDRAFRHPTTYAAVSGTQSADRVKIANSGESFRRIYCRRSLYVFRHRAVVSEESATRKQGRASH